MVRIGTTGGRGPATLAITALACAGMLAAQSLPDPPTREVAVSEPVTGGGGVDLAVYEAGTPGAPAIVLIHGFTQNYLTWQHQLESELADDLHLVAFDLRGHGASDKPLDTEQYTEPSVWAEDLAAVIRSRGLERPVLVGWSYGGYVIADYLRRYGQDGIGGIVLVSSVTKNGTDEATAHFTDEILSAFGDVLATDVRSSLRGTRTLVDLFAPPGSEAWRVAYGSGMMVPPPARQGMFSRVLDNDDVLAAITVPTLVVHGRHDRIVRLSASEHSARTIPGARLVVYDGAGHAPHLDRPDRFNRDLAEFVRSVRR